jgi:predicted unusual protein kinase regulating ubiquinone biosynthesis (AarF/ABC1/UbiB family)
VNTKLVRGSILGAAAARATAKKAGLAVGQPFRNQVAQENASQKADQEIATILFEACTKLRGSALKIAQVLSTEPELIPLVYRQEFAKASHQVPPINRAMLTKILRTELGEQRSLFADFELQPFAAASLGQVHAAVNHAGVPLAVKVQYPGAAANFSSDIAMLRAVLRSTRYARTFAACFDEVAARFREELDYCHEATNTTWFREQLTLPGVVVPEVHTELSTKRVITTTRLSGKHIDEWLLGNPPQQERDRYGQLLVDLLNHSTFVMGAIHADPNFGNYLFRDDGTLGLIDFGCVKHLEPSFLEAARATMLPGEPEPDATESLHRGLGVVYRHDVPAAELRGFLQRWGTWLDEPYREDFFDFAHSDEYFQRGAQLGRELYGYIERYEGPFVYFGRAQQGLMRILQRLSAKVRMTPGPLTRLEP